MLERGEGIEVDKAESAKWYEKAAEAGHLAAQNNLGAAYYLGDGVPCPQVQGSAWYGIVRKRSLQLNRKDC